MRGKNNRPWRQKEQAPIPAVVLDSRLGYRCLYLFSTALRSRLFRRSVSGSGPRFCRVASSRPSLHLWLDNAWSFPLVGLRPALSVSRIVAGRSVPSSPGFLRSLKVRKERVKSILQIFQSSLISTLVRLGSLSYTSWSRTRTLYICLFHASVSGATRFCLWRSSSSIFTGSHQLSEPASPFHLRST